MDLNRARRRSALAAILALAASPDGFTVTGFAEQVRVMTGQSIAGYSARHASYDLRKIRGKHLGSTNPAEPAPQTTIRQSLVPRFLISVNTEGGTKRGRLRGLVLPVGGVGEVGVPAPVVVGEGVVEDAGADLQ